MCNHRCQKKPLTAEEPRSTPHSDQKSDIFIEIWYKNGLHIALDFYCRCSFFSQYREYKHQAVKSAPPKIPMLMDRIIPACRVISHLRSALSRHDVQNKRHVNNHLLVEPYPGCFIGQNLYRCCRRMRDIFRTVLRTSSRPEQGINFERPCRLVLLPQTHNTARPPKRSFCTVTR